MVVVVGGVKKSSCVDLSQETVAARTARGEMKKFPHSAETLDDDDQAKEESCT